MEDLRRAPIVVVWPYNLLAVSRPRRTASALRHTLAATGPLTYLNLLTEGKGKGLLINPLWSCTVQQHSPAVLVQPCLTSSSTTVLSRSPRRQRRLQGYSRRILWQPFGQKLVCTAVDCVPLCAACHLAATSQGKAVPRITSPSSSEWA